MLASSNFFFSPHFFLSLKCWSWIKNNVEKMRRRGGRRERVYQWGKSYGHFTVPLLILFRPLNVLRSAAAQNSHNKLSPASVRSESLWQFALTAVCCFSLPLLSLMSRPALSVCVRVLQQKKWRRRKKLEGKVSERNLCSFFSSFSILFISPNSQLYAKEGAFIDSVREPLEADTGTSCVCEILQWEEIE